MKAKRQYCVAWGCRRMLPVGRKNPRCTKCLREAGTPGHGGNYSRHRGRR